MSVIIGRLRKDGVQASDVDLRGLWRRLPFGVEPSVRHIEMGKAEICLFDYGAAQEFERIAQNERYEVLAQGVITEAVKHWLPKVLLSEKANVDPTANPESVCGVAISSDELRVFTSCSGTDGFLTYEDDTQWVFSNHHSPIGEFVSETHLSQSALAWSVAKYHNFESEHHIVGISRTRPGSVWTARADGVFEEPMATPWQRLSERIENAELPQLIGEIGDSLSSYILGVPKAKSLSLSGGKDSRAVLGMLGDDVYGRWISFSTGGEPYAPDVMAAVELMKVAGLSEQHYVSQPPLVSRPSDLVGPIVNDLLSDWSTSSLADLRPAVVRNSMVIGGHEYGTKGTPQHLSLEQLISRESSNIQSSELLSDSGKSLLTSLLVTDLEDKLTDVPAQKMETAWKLSYRLPLLMGATITGRNTTATEVHPFLDYRVLRIVLGADPEFLSAQALHYFFNRRMTCQIENAPFANDQWPDSLRGVLRDLGIEWRGRPAAPYRFNRAFPSQSGFGRYNWRLELFKAMRPKVIEYLNDGDYDRTLVSPRGMVDLVSKDAENWTFENLYQLGSILKFCLVNELGGAILDARNRDSIELVVRDFIGSEIGHGSASLPSEEVALKEALDKANVAISDLAEQIRTATENFSPTISVVWALDAIRNGVMTLSQMEDAIPSLERFSGLRAIPAESRLEFDLPISSDGQVLVSGFVLKDPATTLLVGFKGETDADVLGATVSPAGFHYFYVVPDEKGFFEKELKFGNFESDKLRVFIQRWYTDGEIYVALNAEPAPVDE